MNIENQKSLYNYAVYLLARRSYHSVSLREKLLKKGAKTDDVEQVISKLKEFGFIDDEEYVRIYIEDQLARRPQGIRLIRYKLLRKGIKGECVERELAGHSLGEVEIARRALEKKEKLLEKGPALPKYKRKEKLFRFLAGRGFPADTIYKILS